MKIIETLKGLVPALALMAVCSMAILYLPQWNREPANLPAADGATQQKTPPADQQDGGQA